MLEAWHLALISSLTVLFLGACGQFEPSAYSESTESMGIFGGEELSQESPLLRFAVRIEGKFGSHQPLECSGSLIHKRVVLTAAHCLDESPEFIRSLKVVFASGEVRGASLVVRPDEYRESLDNHQYTAESIYYDLGLIFLDEPAPGGQAPVLLQQLRIPDSEMQKFWVAGVGANQAQFGEETETGRRVISSGGGTFRGVQLSRQSSSTESDQIVSLQAKKGICVGDSGAPAMIRREGRWVQIGIATFTRSTPENPCQRTGHFLNLAQKTSISEAARIDWVFAQVKSFTNDDISVP